PVPHTSRSLVDVKPGSGKDRHCGQSGRRPRRTPPGTGVPFPENGNDRPPGTRDKPDTGPPRKPAPRHTPPGKRPVQGPGAVHGTNGTAEYPEPAELADIRRLQRPFLSHPERRADSKASGHSADSRTGIS